MSGITTALRMSASMIRTGKELLFVAQELDEAASHIEAQAELIRDLSDCLEDMTKHYVEVRNDLYGFEAAEEIEVIAAGKLIALSKSTLSQKEENEDAK